MSISEFTSLLNQPNAITEKQSIALEAVIKSFPYFQSAKALYLKGLYNENSYKYNSVLKQTAAHTTDRSVLFDFITSDEFTIIDRNVYDRKLEELMQLNINESEIIIPEKIIPASDVVEKESQSKDEKLSKNPINEFIPKKTIDSFIETPTEKKLSNENLLIGRPLAFRKDERHSFQEWLQLTKIQPIQRDKEDNTFSKIDDTSYKTEQNKLKKLNLINKFIDANPKIPQIREATNTDFSIEVSDTSHLMTETLARVYLEQKKYQKAIQAYEILILKYPEKSVFFADLIQDIKKIQHNNL